MRLLLFTILSLLCLHPQLTLTQEMVAVNEVYVNYLDKGNQTDYFIISNLNGGVDVNNAWLSVGLNGQPQMDGSVAVVCKNVNGQGVIEHYYLIGRIPQLIDAGNPSTGLSKVSITINQGFLVCQFTRENTFNRYVGSIDSGYAYVLTAFGAGIFGFHNQNRGVTSQKVLLTTPSTTSSPPTTRPVTTNTTVMPTTRPTTDRPSTSTMVSTTTGGALGINWLYENSMGFKMSWTNNEDDTTDFVYETPLSSNGNVWSAFAMSNDNGMGMDDVAVCKFYCSGSVCTTSVEHYYNLNRNSMPLNANNRTVGFTNPRVLRADGKLLCSFTRKNSMPAQANYFNSVEKPYFILNADGITDNQGTVFYHTRRAVSPITYSLVGSTLTTLNPIPTGFTTNAPVGTVQPIGQVIDQIVQAFVGFFSFLSKLLGQQAQ